MPECRACHGSGECEPATEPVASTVSSSPDARLLRRFWPLIPLPRFRCRLVNRASA